LRFNFLVSLKPVKDFPVCLPLGQNFKHFYSQFCFLVCVCVCVCVCMYVCWVFSRQGLVSHLSRQASNPDPPDLCLLSSWDYRPKPLGSGSTANSKGYVCPEYLFIFLYYLKVIIANVCLCFEIGSHCVTQNGLKLSIFLSRPPEYCITGVHHHSQLNIYW
jgi:hypothetical protein